MTPLSTCDQTPSLRGKKAGAGQKRKRDEDGSDEEDELKTFKRRPKAVVNRPMVQPPVDRVRKQRIELSMAQVDPTASFEERVAQFDRLEAIAKKRESKLLKKQVRTLNRYSYCSINMFVVLLAANEMPEDVVAFLEEIFDKPMHTWRYDPGYATRVVASCPPPSNSSILVSHDVQ